MKHSAFPHGLGIFSNNEAVYFFFNDRGGKVPVMKLHRSTDGFDFRPHEGELDLRDEKSRKQNTGITSDYRISEQDGQYILVYKVRLENVGSKTETRLATSKDLLKWKTAGKAGTVTETGMLVPNYQWQGKYVMFYGENTLRIAYSADLKTWQMGSEVLAPRSNMFDSGPLRLGSAMMTEKGIAVIYHIRSRKGQEESWSMGAALFDPKKPDTLVWRCEKPVLDHIDGLANRHVWPLGIVDRGDNMLISYWEIEKDGIFAIAHPHEHGRDKKVSHIANLLARFKENPILKPITTHFWESKATFNPAAIYENGKIHLIYRAVGEHDVSVLGYATSADGVTIDERLDEPIYVPRETFEMNVSGGPVNFLGPFASGGGAYGGCEDPRVTKIDGKFYVTYVAYDGGNPPRVAMSSISEKDFHERNWGQWAKPVLISPPGVVDKNAAILPEKVDGKYVVFHRIYPNILVDYVDSLDDFDGRKTWLKGDYAIRPDRSSWDSRKIGVGATPMKTKYGWLLIYQAVGDQDAGRYKIGAMILDSNRPERVLYRSKQPILEPQMWYENEGFKYGVAYPCGAAIKDDDLFVYYGGADMVVCAAQTHLPTFLEQLRHADSAPLTPVRLQQAHG